MDMKKARDQARKENKALKQKSKGNAKAAKEFAATAVDNVVASKNTVSQKATEAKAAIVHTAQTAKSDAKADVKTAGKAPREMQAGAGKGIKDMAHAGKNADAKVKHH
ncbi:MAG: hypothetical protein LLF96_08175 [Eubacteriales bacterium]|nr:hypothetical protein [Eubacteriales bacterium]